jgi:hypothetical protein
MAILGTLLAIPAMILFYVLWVVAMLLRPFFLIATCCALWNAHAVCQKAKLTAQGACLCCSSLVPCLLKLSLQVVFCLTAACVIITPRYCYYRLIYRWKPHYQC